MIPAAMPASAGTRAMNGSTPASVVALLAPATPRSRSRYAPMIARTTTSPSISRRLGEAPGRPPRHVRGHAAMPARSARRQPPARAS